MLSLILISATKKKKKKNCQSLR